jgi:hypothetical protein
VDCSPILQCRIVFSLLGLVVREAAVLLVVGNGIIIRGLKGMHFV